MVQYTYLKTNRKTIVSLIFPLHPLTSSVWTYTSVLRSWSPTERNKRYTVIKSRWLYSFTLDFSPDMNVAPKLRLASFVLIVAIVLMYFKLMTKNPGWCSLLISFYCASPANWILPFSFSHSCFIQASSFFLPIL